MAECGTHAGEVDAYSVGERTLAQRLYLRLRADELLTADRGFYSWTAWDTAAATGAALLWRAPTQLALPVLRVLPDGTYHSLVMDSRVRGARQDRILAAARTGTGLSNPLLDRAKAHWLRTGLSSGRSGHTSLAR